MTSHRSLVLLAATLAIFVAFGTRPETELVSKAILQNLAPADPVDLVYCWAGETREGCTTGHNKSGSLAATHDGGCDLGELRYSLRSVAKFAPWMRKIFILVNPPADGGPVALPSFVNKATAGPIEVVNRCSLFKKSEDCPTMNTHACQSVVHLVPGLSNKFVYMDDDDLFSNPLSVSDLWDSEGRVRVFDHKEGELHMVYGAPRSSLMDYGPDVPPEHVPMKLAEQMHHAPIALRRDSLQEMEAEYPDFFSFVRSHKRRFQCCNHTKSSGPSVTESMSPIWGAWLLKSGQGVLDTSRHDSFCATQLPSGIPCFGGHFLSPHTIFANLNSAIPQQWDKVQAILDKKLAEPAAYEFLAQGE